MDRLFGGSPSNISSTHSRRDSGQFYFVPREPGVTAEVRDKGDEDAVIEVHTEAHDDTYEPKPVNRSLSLRSQGQDLSIRVSASARADSIHSTLGSAVAPPDRKPNPLSRALLAIFGGHKVPKSFDETGAKKVDPKIYFSLERTFLSWMTTAIWLAGVSIAIGSGSSKGVEAFYSLFFLGIAIAFVIYALATYAKRSLMIVRRSPGPYEARWGPIVIGALVVFSFAAQYCVFIASFLSNK